MTNIKSVSIVETIETTILLLLGALLLSSCSKHEKPTFIYMEEMVYSPAFKAQKEGGMRMPVKGTIPRGYHGYEFVAMTTDQAGKENHNPLPRTMAVMNRGQAMFNTYCIVCHGPQGMGDGGVISHGFPRPPSLQSDKIRNYPDGSIYHIITMGQNVMPSYASQIRPEDRWAIIHYIRALQRSMKPTDADIKEMESE